MDKQTQVDGAVGSDGGGSGSVDDGTLNVRKLFALMPRANGVPGYLLDQIAWQTEAYILEQSQLKFLDADEALGYIKNCCSRWLGLKHEEVLYGGPDRVEGCKVLARGLAWLAMLNGEIEFAGRKITSILPALAAFPAQAPGLSNTEGAADQSDSTKEDV